MDHSQTNSKFLCLNLSKLQPFHNINNSPDVILYRAMCIFPRKISLVSVNGDHLLHIVANLTVMSFKCKTEASGVVRAPFEVWGHQPAVVFDKFGMKMLYVEGTINI